MVRLQHNSRQSTVDARVQRGQQIGQQGWLGCQIPVICICRCWQAGRNQVNVTDLDGLTVRANGQRQFRARPVHVLVLVPGHLEIDRLTGERDQWMRERVGLLAGKHLCQVVNQSDIDA